MERYRVTVALLVAAGTMAACSSPAKTEDVSGHVYANVCLPSTGEARQTCAALAVPDVSIVISRGPVVVGTATTDRNGYAAMKVAGSGEVTITGTSPFLKDGRFTTTANLQGYGSYSLDITYPVAAGTGPPGS